MKPSLFSSTEDREWKCVRKRNRRDIGWHNIFFVSSGLTTKGWRKEKKEREKVCVWERARAREAAARRWEVGHDARRASFRVRERNRYNPYSVSLGLLLKGYRDATRFCSCLEQSRLCLQCSRWNMVGYTSFWESCCLGPEFLGCIHQSWKCIERSPNFWQVRF